MGDNMYKIASNLTQFKNDKNGPVMDSDGKHVQEPVGCIIGLFRWPAEGLVVPADFFADDGAFLQLVRNPGVDVFTSKDGEDWRLLEDVDEAAGASPSGRPAPSPEDIMKSVRAGVNITPRTGDRTPQRGPMNEVEPDKVRAYLEGKTTKKKGRKGRKGQQQAMNG